MEKSFKCINCGFVFSSEALGTKNRNHCPKCLWSQHLDLSVPGDRMADCKGGMKPIGLAFKDEGGKKLGELSLVHQCVKCGIHSKNRVAGDDDVFEVIRTFKDSLGFDPGSIDGIKLLAQDSTDEIISQLFGRPNLSEYKKKFGL